MDRGNKQSTKPFVMIPLSIFTDGCFLTPKARAVYCALKTFENINSGRCFPGIKKIAERSGYKKDAVIEALDELEEFNWIIRNKCKGKSTSYKFTFPVLNQYGHSISPTLTEADIWKDWLRAKPSSDVLDAKIVYPNNGFDKKTIYRLEGENFKAFFGRQLSEGFEEVEFLP